MIDKPGLYDVDERTYHHTVFTPTLALGSSGAVTLIDECPARFWYDSPLNPRWRPDDATNESCMGNAVHTAILEPHRWSERVVVVPFDTYKKQAAQDQRDSALAVGKIPIRAVDAAHVNEIAETVRQHPIAGKLFSDGQAEKTLVWFDQESGVWCKSRPDYLKKNQIVQVKTMPSAHPTAAERHCYNMGYYQRAGWEIEAALNVGVIGSTYEYLIVALERQPPYLCAVYRLSDRCIEWAYTKNAKAREIFAECSASGVWGGYDDAIRELTLPSFAEFALEERRARGDFELII